MVSPHAAHSNGRLSWSGLSGGLIRASHVGAPHLAHLAISASFRPYGCGRRHCTRKSGFLALVRASQRSLSIPVCRRSVGTDKNAGASRHLVQTDLFSHGCKARWSNSRRRLACPPPAATTDRFLVLTRAMPACGRCAILNSQPTKLNL